MMEKNVIDLFTLQTEVRQSLESSFPARVWVRAEVSAVKVRGGGHCYLELSQSNESGLVAKASAIIWASRFRVLGPYFESVAGSPLQPGITVLLRVQVNYSQLYGLSLIVDDIDASCTLGEKEKERLATIERLKKEGLLDRQKSLEMTALPYRLAVVSAPDAAGYRDFERHLKGNAYGFVLETVLYEAVMQGASAPESISDALKAAASAEKPFDAVLVLRGGGSNLDLSCFDDYSLCDMVAWRYVKTPTALADTFIEIYADEDQYISSFAGRLKTAFLNKISLMGSRVDVLESRIAGADPRRILSRGYALVVDDGGVVMKNAAGHSAGDNVKVMFADGTLDCRVTGIQLKQEDNDGRV